MCVQEEITQGAVSLSVETGKMTADLLQKAVKKVLEEMQKKPSQRTLRQGKQTLHQLKQHGASLTNIEITEQNIKAVSYTHLAGRIADSRRSAHIPGCWACGRLRYPACRPFGRRRRRCICLYQYGTGRQRPD